MRCEGSLRPALSLTPETAKPAQEGIDDLEVMRRRLADGDFRDGDEDDDGGEDEDKEIVGARWKDPVHESEEVERLLEPGCEEELDRFIDKVRARVPEPAGEEGRFVGTMSLGIGELFERLGQGWKESLAQYEKTRGDQAPPEWLERGEQGGLAGVYDLLWGEPTASDRREALKGCDAAARKTAKREEAFMRLWRRCDGDVEKISKAMGDDPQAPWEIHVEAQIKRERREAGLPDLYDSAGECCSDRVCGMSNLNLDRADLERIEKAEGNNELVSNLGLKSSAIQDVPEENVFGRMVGVDGTVWEFADVGNRTWGDAALRKEMRDEWNSIDGGEAERFAGGNLENTASGVQRDLKIMAMQDLKKVQAGRSLLLFFVCVVFFGGLRGLGGVGQGSAKLKLCALCSFALEPAP